MHVYSEVCSIVFNGAYSLVNMFRTAALSLVSLLFIERVGQINCSSYLLFPQ